MKLTVLLDIRNFEIYNNQLVSFVIFLFWRCLALFLRFLTFYLWVFLFDLLFFLVEWGLVFWLTWFFDYLDKWRIYGNTLVILSLNKNRCCNFLYFLLGLTNSFGYSRYFLFFWFGNFSVLFFLILLFLLRFFFASMTFMMTAASFSQNLSINR
jgi:hypothetical protein